MNIAIYSRKSKFTGKGDSIENQIEMCTAYAKEHFKDCTILVYEDEGFSGKNSNRPEFQRLMQDIKSKKINILMCYRLDRISRNVADFSSTLDILSSHDVAFISIREQFDTTTPMGRAMMYIASVFAQLERETIAERVRDNMLQLAHSGRWLGGITPLGFSSEQESLIDMEGKNRKKYKLVIDEKEITLVRLLFEKFIELGSVYKLEGYCLKNEIKTRKNDYFDLTSLKFILTNPVYLTADQAAYNFFNSVGCNISRDKNDFDGTHGIMTYNRTNQSKNKQIKNDVSDWIISVGEHAPIISSKIWIEVQKTMQKNSDKAFRKVHNQEALLPGLLRCAKCGSYMRPKRSRMSADGTKNHYYYICEMKEKTNGLKCDMKNVAGHKLDQSLIEQLKQLSLQSSSLDKKLDKDMISIAQKNISIQERINEIQSKITTNEKLINNLLSTLGEAKDTIASKYIIDKVNILGNEITTYNEHLIKLETEKSKTTAHSQTLDLMQDILRYFNENIDQADIQTKRTMIKSIVDAAVWDGDNLHLDIFGSNTLGEL